jgi:hypothetical protein
LVELRKKEVEKGEGMRLLANEKGEKREKGFAEYKYFNWRLLSMKGGARCTMLRENWID